MIYSGNEFDVGDVLIRLISRVAEEFSFLAKARAQVGIKITGLFFTGRFVGDQQNIVIVILNVPVIN